MDAWIFNVEEQVSLELIVSNQRLWAHRLCAEQPQCLGTPTKKRQCNQLGERPALLVHMIGTVILFVGGLQHFCLKNACEDLLQFWLPPISALPLILKQNLNSLILGVQITNIEVVGRQKDVFDSLKSGHSAIKELQSEISLDDVQKLMDETAEAKQYQDVRGSI